MFILNFPRTVLFKTLCVVLPAVSFAALAEGYYRWFRVRDYWTVENLLSTSLDKKLPFTFDEELGFRPVLDGQIFRQDGTLANAYPQTKRPGTARVLFVGDSVTARGMLIAALEHVDPRGGYEYWNAGVENYATQQQWKYYERYNYRVEPDHVVLTFHNNDFSAQPVADFNDDGHMTFYGGGPPWQVRLPWLLRQSALVRDIVYRRYKKTSELEAPTHVEQALRNFQQRLAAEKIAFSVVLFPILKPYDQWKPDEIVSREQALAIFQKLGLKYFDVLPALQQALAEGVDVCERPGDPWHPSLACAMYLARQLRAEGLLEAGSERQHTVDARGKIRGEQAPASVR